MSKKVIINADDFGFSPGTSEGILRGHLEGVITSTTIATNMPAAEHAVGLLDQAPELGVGVHLNVPQGPPLSPEGAALAGDDGLMNRTATEVVRMCAFHPGRLRAVEAEFDAQIRWALDHGIRPTHLDSHRHSHAFCPIFLRVAKLARRYTIPLVRWHYEVLPGGGWDDCPAKQRRSARLLNLFGAINARLAPSLRATNGTWGVRHTGLIDSAWLIRAAETVQDGVTEIMTHPGSGDDLDAAATRLIASRPKELAALCDPQVKEAFKKNGIELTHYGRI